VSKRAVFSIAGACIATAVASCMAVVWVTGDVRVVGLGLIPAGVMAAALVGYFEWRTDLRRRILSDSSGHRAALEIPTELTAAEDTWRSGEAIVTSTSARPR
jgi:hypothetical protein